MSGGRYSSRNECERRLRSGGVVLLATDTLPGLHCRSDDEAAVDRLRGLKGRPDGKPLLVLAGSLAQALALVAPLRADQLAVCSRYWPGPFSFVLPAGGSIPASVTGGSPTIAVRVPAVEPLRDLILGVGVPLVSTSANLAGEAPLTSMAAARDQFGDKVDGIWPDTGENPLATRASALVDLTAEPFRLLRPGPLSFAGSGPV